VGKGPESEILALLGSPGAAWPAGAFSSRSGLVVCLVLLTGQEDQSYAKAWCRLWLGRDRLDLGSDRHLTWAVALDQHLGGSEA